MVGQCHVFSVKTSHAHYDPRVVCHVMGGVGTNPRVFSDSVTCTLIVLTVVWWMVARSHVFVVKVSHAHSDLCVYCVVGTKPLIFVVW